MNNYKFSNIAWEANRDVYNKIVKHPFNQKLSNGTLKPYQFSYYIEQDSIYLMDFSKTLTLIASRMSIPSLISKFIDFAKGAIIAEQESVHKYYKKTFGQQLNTKTSLACMGYTNYLMRCASSESIESAIAAVVPCFWVYSKVGHYIKRQSVQNNPYQRWIDTYASGSFSESVNMILQITNNYYKNTNHFTKNLMLKAFETSMIWEYRFWDDSYNLNYFANI